MNQQCQIYFGMGSEIQNEGYGKYDDCNKGVAKLAICYSVGVANNL